MNNLSREQLEKIASDEGKKLAFLIYSLKCQERIKKAWLDLLPEFSLDQIRRLIDLFENEYLNEQTENIDKFFEDELKNLQNIYQKEQEKIDKEAIKKVKDLIKKIS